MNVECPNCGVKGRIDESRRPPGADSVICQRCSHKIPLAPSEVNSITLPPPDEATSPVAAATSSPHAEPLPSSSPVPPAAAPPQAVCTMCSQKFPQDEMVRFGVSWVCAACKPDYVQMLELGVTQPGSMRYAGFWIRFGAKFLDGLILGVLGMAISFLLGLFVSKSSANPSAILAVTALQFLIQTGAAVAYTAYFLSNHRATPGKMACGLVVVTPDGGTLNYGRAAGRYFAEILSSLILGIGYLMVAFDEEKRALHDRICTTRVIYR